MYRLNDEKMFCDIADGIAIVINSRTGMYYGMNQPGTAVFAQLAAGADVAAVCRALRALPDAPDDVESRVAAFVDRLLGMELIVPGPASADALPAIDPAAMGQDGFLLEVNEYADAQEMLLADPIHDVDSETGWEPVLKEE